MPLHFNLVSFPGLKFLSNSSEFIGDGYKLFFFLLNV